jgi:hypothetical protein
MDKIISELYEERKAKESVKYIPKKPVQEKREFVDQDAFN